MIVFLIGAPMSGKTYIRNELFKDCDYVDIYDFQQNLEDDYSLNVFERLEQAELDMLDVLKYKVLHKPKDSVLVLEHCLSNSNRRVTYFSMVKEWVNQIKDLANEEIICLFVEPRLEDRKFLVESRLAQYSEETDRHVVKRWVTAMNDWYDYCVKPSKSDGFDSVLKIVPILDEPTTTND